MPVRKNNKRAREPEVEPVPPKKPRAERHAHEKRILVSHIPEGTTLDDIQQTFGTALGFFVHKTPCRSGFVNFHTSEEARQAASRKTLALHGITCKVDYLWKGSQELCFKCKQQVHTGRCSNETERTIFVTEVPLSVTDGELQAQFDNTEVIWVGLDLEDGVTKSGSIVFTTPQHARTALARKHIKLAKKQCPLKYMWNAGKELCLTCGKPGHWFWKCPTEAGCRVLIHNLSPWTTKTELAAFLEGLVKVRFVNRSSTNWLAVLTFKSPQAAGVAAAQNIEIQHKKCTLALAE
eukprot:NODE_3451_length_964_cov_31.749104_g3302_i0.p1 GENE.NODE_3451_length_964_cov_31.749104_g3302_i0~~NODE_3451_length_964_cov_31.749104_g3302_i0.p1  ORF type:complete len:293 (+),score=69.55 NODE_3451_length_964_cov_31.749104_g3302_i0:49-927(+)